jgi:hypothetical protein
MEASKSKTPLLAGLHGKQGTASPALAWNKSNENPG